MLGQTKGGVKNMLGPKKKGVETNQGLTKFIDKQAQSLCIAA